MKNVFELMEHMESIAVMVGDNVGVKPDVSITPVDSNTIRLVWTFPLHRLFAVGIKGCNADMVYDRYLELSAYSHIDQHLYDINRSLHTLIEEARKS